MVTHWSRTAALQLQKAYNFIKKDSVQNAEKVRERIISKTEELIQLPERYPLDKYKINNKGQYRAFELYHYRISYKIMKDTVLIVRMRHTSMSPLEY